MPENTLLSYQNSIDVGADSLEGDVHATNVGLNILPDTQLNNIQF